MVGQVFILFMLAGLAMLTFNEGVRFRRAARDPEGVPYPRRRFLRRVTVATLMITMLMICLVWPERAPAGIRFALSGLLLILLMLGMILLLRDLHETSRTVAALHSELNQKTVRELEQLFELQNRAGTKTNDSSPPKSDG